MPYRIRYDNDNNIVYVCQEGKVSVEERMQALQQLEQLQLEQLQLPSGTCMLSNVKGLTHLVGGDDSQALLQAYEASSLKFRKVAILHNKGFPAYTIPVTDGLLNGHNTEEFTSAEAAEVWLKS